MACLRSASYFATVLRHTGHAVYTTALAMHNERCTVVFLASPACQCPLHLYICSLIALASDSVASVATSLQDILDPCLRVPISTWLPPSHCSLLSLSLFFVIETKLDFSLTTLSYN